MDDQNKEIGKILKSKINSGDYATINGVLRGHKMTPKEKFHAFARKQKEKFNMLGEAEKLLLAYYTGAVVGTLTERIKNHLSKK